jgi:hypothetical protein
MLEKVNLASPAGVNQASPVGVNQASLVALDLALLRVGRGVCHIGQGEIM